MSYDIKLLKDELKKINSDIDNIINKLKLIKKSNIKIISSKIINKNKNIKRGLQKKIKVPIKICKYLNLEEDLKLSKPDVQKLIYKKIKENKLFYEKDKRVLRVDKELSELFNIDMNVNNSINPKDKLGFNIYNFNKYLCRLYK